MNCDKKDDNPLSTLKPDKLLEGDFTKNHPVGEDRPGTPGTTAVEEKRQAYGRENPDADGAKKTSRGPILSPHPNSASTSAWLISFVGVAFFSEKTWST